MAVSGNFTLALYWIAIANEPFKRDVQFGTEIRHKCTYMLFCVILFVAQQLQIWQRCEILKLLPKNLRNLY